MRRDHHPAVHHLYRLRLLDEPAHFRPVHRGDHSGHLDGSRNDDSLLHHRSINGWGYLIRLSFKRVVLTGIGAWLGFFAIGLVLWGTYTGKFSPTEAAGVTVGFCKIVGMMSFYASKVIGDNTDIPVEEKSVTSQLVVDGFTLKEIPSIVVRSAQISGILAPLIAVSVGMQQILSLLGAQEVIGNFVTSMGGYYPVLFTAMAMGFVAGMILESLPVTIILAPILAPIAASVGVDLIHFSVIFLVGASIGFITPHTGSTCMWRLA